jgi:hypothetical protein
LTAEIAGNTLEIVIDRYVLVKHPIVPATERVPELKVELNVTDTVVSVVV